MPFDRDGGAAARAAHLSRAARACLSTAPAFPAWFDRGTRRPDPSGRAFLALLACADEDLSARRFAEYLSLGQVPRATRSRQTAWVAARRRGRRGDRARRRTRRRIPSPRTKRTAASRRTANATVSSPARCARRGAGRNCSSNRRSSASSIAGSAACAGCETNIDDGSTSSSPTNPNRRASARSGATSSNSISCAAFALPIVREHGRVAAAGAWRGASGSTALSAPGAARAPPTRARACACCASSRRSATIGPVSLREVREVLTPRLLTLTHEPPRRRHGRVFVGTPGRRARPIVRRRVRARPGRARVSAAAARGRAAARRTRAIGCHAAAGETEAARRRRAAAAAAGRRRRVGTRVSVVAARRAAGIAASACRRSTCSTSRVRSKGIFPAYATLRDRALRTPAAPRWRGRRRLDPDAAHRRLRARPVDAVSAAARQGPARARRAARGISTSSVRICSDR